MGKRPDLIGGGLVRSAGGWLNLIAMRRAKVFVKGDERILGESEFVDSVLSRARVAEIYGMEKHEVFSKGGDQRKVKAKSLLCFWAVREIGMSLRELAGRLEMNAPGVGFAVERGEAIAHRNGYKLIE